MSRAPRSRPSLRTLVLRAVLLGFALLVLAQAIPYGRDHTNPAVTQAAHFPSARVAQIVTDSCAD